MNFGYKNNSFKVLGPFSSSLPEAHPSLLALFSFPLAREPLLPLAVIISTISWAPHFSPFFAWPSSSSPRSSLSRLLRQSTSASPVLLDRAHRHHHSCSSVPFGWTNFHHSTSSPRIQLRWLSRLSLASLTLTDYLHHHLFHEHHL